MNIKNMDKFTHTYMEIISESKDLDMLEDIKKNWGTPAYGATEKEQFFPEKLMKQYPNLFLQVAKIHLANQDWFYDKFYEYFKKNAAKLIKNRVPIKRVLTFKSRPTTLAIFDTHNFKQSFDVSYKEGKNSKHIKLPHFKFICSALIDKNEKYIRDVKRDLSHLNYYMTKVKYSFSLKLTLWPNGNYYISDDMDNFILTTLNTDKPETFIVDNGEIDMNAASEIHTVLDNYIKENINDIFDLTDDHPDEIYKEYLLRPVKSYVEHNRLKNALPLQMFF